MEQRGAQDEAQSAEQLNEEQAWLSSVTLGDFPGLEDDLTIALSPKCTVLVGRNGAGKSLVFDALLAASEYVHHASIAKQAPPGRFQCRLRLSPDTEVGYEYRRTGEEGVSGAARRTGRDGTARFVETCWQQKAGQKSELWHVDQGTLHYAGGEEVQLGPQMGRLSKGQWDRNEPSALQARALNALLSFQIVHAGVPRESQGRGDVLVRVLRFPDERGSGGGRYPRAHGPSDRVGSIASRIVYFHEVSLFAPITEGMPGISEELEAFEVISQAVKRVGLADELRVDSYGPAPGREKQNGGEEWVDEVKLDGVNIGRASDGTCRVLETLLCLLPPQAGRRPLLLEEPETGIHPGLLLRLLHELDAYDGQIIISTHSPQVVSWAKPEDIRLVERRKGKTTVRSLAAPEADRVHEYLVREGTLGEFVYGGALDDEV